MTRQMNNAEDETFRKKYDDAFDKKVSIPDALTKLGDIYRERNKTYGDNYKELGKVFEAMLPGGEILLDSPKDFNRFVCLVNIIQKITRYGNMFDRGGHADSLDDISVYAQMLQELDSENQD